MAAARAVSGPPLGTVIEQADGSNSMWNGKQWVPAAKGDDGSWAVDSGKLAQMGLGSAQGPAGSADEQKYVAGLRTQNDAVQNLADMAGDFIRRNKQTGTGGVLAIPGVPTIEKALSSDGDNLAQMDRDSVGMATSLRSVGQRLTQMEFMKNLGAGPSVRNQGPANQKVTDQILKYAAPLAAAKTQLYSAYLDKHRTLAGADQAWAQFKAQHIGPDGFYAADPITNQQAASAALKARSASTSAAPKVLQPSDYLNQDDE